MKYYRDNQEIIAAEIEKKRLEQEYQLLRTIAEGRRKKAEWQAKVLLKPTLSNWEIESAYIESQFLKGTR